MLILYKISMGQPAGSKKLNNTTRLHAGVIISLFCLTCKSSTIFAFCFVACFRLLLFKLSSVILFIVVLYLFSNCCCCPSLSCPVFPCPVRSCSAQPCPVLPCPALPCPVLSFPALYTLPFSLNLLLTCFPRACWSCGFTIGMSNAHGRHLISLYYICQTGTTTSLTMITFVTDTVSNTPYIR